MGLVSTITRWFRGRSEEPAAAPVPTPPPTPAPRVESLPVKARESDTELRNAKERLAQAEKKLADAESKLSAAQKTAADLKERLSAAESKSKSSDDAAASLRKKLEAAESKAKSSDNAAASLREKLSAAESKCAASEQTLAQLRDRLTAAEKSAADLQAAIASSEAKAASSEKSAAELRSKLERTESQAAPSVDTEKLAAAESKLASTEALVADLSEKLASTESRLQMTERELARTREDLAREKVAESSEHAARTEAERASEAKDQFLSVVSHEMRTPLTSILGWASMLATEQVGKETKEVAVQRLLESARQEARIIDDLLDFSRVVAGRLSFAASEVDLASVLRSVIANQQLTAESRDIRLELHAPREVMVWGDRVRLRQIFGNLAGNAMKFTPDGGRVDVTLEVDGSSARVAVKDTGKGIAPDFLPYVFDWFTQEEPAMQRTSSGMGLGLAIVRQLVELHRGTVTAESEGTGRGATFTVTLPLLDASS